MNALKEKLDTWLGMMSFVAKETETRAEFHYTSPTGVTIVIIRVFRNGKRRWRVGGSDGGLATLHWDKLSEM